MTAEGTLILTRQEIASLMTFGDYVEAVEQAFHLHAEGRSLSPGVLDVGAKDGMFHIKAAGLALGERIYIAVKTNGNFPENVRRFGLPTIQGVITLCDGINGYPLAVLDSTEITVNRTGAATAVAARYLAKPASTIATICGCGKQGRIQLLALKHVLVIGRVFVWDQNEAAAVEFARRISSETGIGVQAVTNLADAAMQSDVIDRVCSACSRLFGYAV